MSVPDTYQGLWHRRLYAEPAAGQPHLVDRETDVVWLQVGRWHADLRVPADRPDFTGVTSLDDCCHEQLVWLASQTAFAGHTIVEGRFCTWHRLVDLAPGLDKDIGTMDFVDADTLLERHPSGIYRETWEREVERQTGSQRMRLDAVGRPRWLAHGERAMAITPRASLHTEHDLLATASTLSRAALLDRLSLCIDFCRYGDSAWQVVRSTHPWHEGRTLRAETTGTTDNTDEPNRA